jgi:5-methyltetrahydrofolate--homocysteine methyltransferase
LSQVQSGADVLDLNVGLAGLDETEVLPAALEAVLEAGATPVCLDSGSPQALAAALAVYPGRALINSVTGKEDSLGEILPLAKAHQAAVIGLTLDEGGIPTEPERRLALARKILARAEAAGLSADDVVIDCLAQAVGADGRAGLATLEAIRLIRAELGVNVVLGASNVSFGLPDRAALNHAFLPMAIAAGATCLILDAAKSRSVVLAADVLAGRDRLARRYISEYKRQRTK